MYISIVQGTINNVRPEHKETDILNSWKNLIRFVGVVKL